MGFIAKLKHGSREIDLNTDPYHMARDWSPPPPLPVSLMSSGNMSNKYAGGKRIDRQFVDRPMSLPLNIKGASAAETHQAGSRLVSFLENSMNDTSEKLYFVYNASDAISYDPKWGQHHRYYEIKDADIAIGRIRLYLNSDIRNQFVAITLPFMVAPLTTGLRQRVGSATGGILEDTIGTEDGLSRGLIIPEATTNKCLNPIFGHGTYGTGYAYGAGVLSADNTDKNFVLFGSHSNFISNPDTSTARNINYSLDVGNTNAHSVSWYVKSPDGGTVDANVCTLLYGATNLTEVYTDLGDGFWRVSAVGFSGVAAATAMILLLEPGVSLYICGLQIEEKWYVTPFCYGDLLDCTWSTAHAATSIRTVARWRIAPADFFNYAQGCFRIIWKAPYASDTIPDNTRIFQIDNSSGFLMIWNASNYWTINDGTAAYDASGGDSSFTAGEIITFHVVFGPSGLDVYKNGAKIITGTNYVAEDDATYFYLGSSATPDLHSNGTYLDLATWDRELTAAEILADYNNVTEHVSGGDGFGQRLNPIPWLWTDDGDDTVDNCYDSTREHWCVVGGVPGNVNAISDYYLSFGGAYADDIFYISITDIDDFIDPEGFVFFDKSGNVVASTCGGEVQTFPVTTSELLTTSTINPYLDIKGARIGIYSRLADASTNLLAAPAYSFAFGSSVIGDQKILGATSAYQGFFIGDIVLPEIDKTVIDTVLTVEDRVNLGVQLQRSTGSGNALVDYVAILKNYVYIDASNYVANLFTSTTKVLVYNHKAYFMSAASDALGESSTLLGDGSMDLFSNKINIIQSFRTSSASANADVITNTMTYDAVHVTPRWSLL